MRPIRFRTGTIMIVIAVIAVLMAMVRALRGPFFDNMVVFAAAVVFLAAAAFAFLLAIIALLLKLIVIFSLSRLIPRVAERD